MLKGWCSGDVNSDCEIAMNESSVTARLLKLAKKMSEDEQLTLLRELEETLLKGSRKHEREPFFMVVDYSTEDRIYKDYIKDISAGGIFIETRMPFSVGQELSLPFPLPNYQKYIKITGELIRITPQGIGVKFKMLNQDQEAMIKSLLPDLPV
jgi:Tfp pilus assembly protein PilZ